MKAVLRNYNQSPRKVRLVANLVRGKDVQKALTILKFADKKAAEAVRKLIASAVANARQKGENEEGLIVKKIFVDEGMKLKRYMPRAFGRASLIRKRRSHITVELGRKDDIKSNKSKN